MKIHFRHYIFVIMHYKLQISLRFFFFFSDGFCVSDIKLDCATNTIKASWTKADTTTATGYEVVLFNASRSVLHRKVLPLEQTEFGFNITSGNRYKVKVIVNHLDPNEQPSEDWSNDICTYKGTDILI